MAARTTPRTDTPTTILQIALANMLQTKAIFLRDSEEHRKDTRERFERIERELEAIKTLLLKHNEILRNLPEAIREKIGFVPKTRES